MKNVILKKISLGTAVALVIGAGGLAVAAMFFDSDLEDSFNLLGGGDGDIHKVTQPMELQGKWLGMRITDLHTRTAARFNIPPNTDGVMVSEIGEQAGLRARQAGVTVGDVIQAVDGNAVSDMADLFDVTRNTDVAQAILVDVLRWGQPMTLVLPAAIYAVPRQGQVGAPPAMGMPQAGGMAIQPQRGMGVPQGRPVMVNPNVGMAGQPVQPAQPVMMNPNMGQPAAMAPGGGGKYYCPQGGHYLGHAAVQPNMQCPYCNVPVVGVQ